MQTPELQTFIDAGKAKGASDEFLAALLTRRGWPVDDVYTALARYWEAATGLAVPAHGTSGESSRDAFLYLLSFSTLATWTTALGSILFALINRWLPDDVLSNLAAYFRSQVTWEMACLAIAFPIYLLATRVIAREAEEHPERLQSGVRKWLTYIALLITAGAMIGDLICFLNYFLTGELTARFVLKVIVVLAISGAIFWYYIGWLRQNRARGMAFGIPAAVLVAATFCTAMSVAGTPSAQRQLEADRTRVQDLRTLAIGIKNIYDSGRGMPLTLEGIRSHKVDPQTGAAYEFRIQRGNQYEVCATFSAGSTEDSQFSYNPNSFWAHGKGRQCFQIDAAKPAPW